MRARNLTPGDVIAVFRHPQDELRLVTVHQRTPERIRCQVEPTGELSFDPRKWLEEHQNRIDLAEWQIIEVLRPRLCRARCCNLHHADRDGLASQLCRDHWQPHSAAA